jgi:hypothetical protein
MVGAGATHLQVVLGGIFSPCNSGRLREAGCNSDTGTCYSGPDRDNFIATDIYRFQCLAPDIPCGRTKIHRVFSQTGVDGHGGAFYIAPADRTTSPLAVHGIPLDGSPDTTLLKDLGSAGPLIHHNQKFLCKERTEPLFCLFRAQGDHVIAEIFVNKIIGNNPIYRDRFNRKFLQKNQRILWSSIL